MTRRALAAHRRRRRARRARGFSIMEVVVALAIAAAGMAAFAEAGGSAGTLLARAQQRAQATAVARDVLGSVGVEVPLAAGRLSGRAQDGTTWQLDVEPLDRVVVDGIASEGTGLFRLRVSVQPPGRYPPQVVTTYRLDGSYLR